MQNELAHLAELSVPAVQTLAHLHLQSQKSMQLQAETKVYLAKLGVRY